MNLKLYRKKNIKKKILILQPYSAQGRAIAKYLRKYSNMYDIIGGLEKNEKKYIIGSYYDSIKYINLDSSIIHSKYDYIIPTGADSTVKLMNIIEFINVGEIFFKKENIILFNKIQILKSLERLGIPIPVTFNSYKEISFYPVFYKQRFETGGGKRGIVYNRSDLLKLANDSSIFFQEYINSPITYGVGFLSIKGELITHFIHQEIYSYPKSGGSGVIVERFFDEKLLEYSRKILNFFQYNGWGLIEYKYCPKRRDYVFMEVNAKFWASIEFAFANNPVFFSKLFGIYYEVKKPINCIVFLDRLACYGIIHFVILLIKYYRCKKVNHLSAVYVLFYNILEKIIKTIKDININ